MRNVIFVEEVVELVAFARAFLRYDAQPGKLAVAPQPLPAHNERAHDRLAYARQLRQRPANRLRGHLQNLGFIRFASRAGQRRCAHEHRHVADEIAGAGRPQDLLLSVARLEDFQPAAQDHGQPKITLARFEENLAAAQDASFAEWLQHRELPVIEFRKSDAFRIAVELLVFVEFSHKRIF